MEIEFLMHTSEILVSKALRREVVSPLANQQTAPVSGYGRTQQLMTLLILAGLTSLWAHLVTEPLNPGWTPYKQYMAEKIH